jgi:HEAT repeat protein
MPAAANRTGGKTADAETWHRSAYALVTAAYIAPELARSEIGRFKSNTIWQVRMYAARAAAILKDSAVMGDLAGDPNDNVRNAAVTGLSQVEQHGADEVYIAQLSRSDGQLLMTAARALRGTKNLAAPPARLDHNYTVFASVVNGMEVVDAVLEGEEIAEVKIILPGKK